MANAWSHLRDRKAEISIGGAEESSTKWHLTPCKIREEAQRRRKQGRDIASRR